MGLPACESAFHTLALVSFTVASGDLSSLATFDYRGTFFFEV